MRTHTLHTHAPATEMPFSGTASAASAVRMRGLVCVNVVSDPNTAALVRRRLR